MYGFSVILEHFVYIILWNPQLPSRSYNHPKYVTERAETQRVIKYMSRFTQALSDEALCKPRAIWPQAVCISQEVPLGSPRKQASHGMPWSCVGSRGRHSHRTQWKCALVSCRTEGQGSQWKRGTPFNFGNLSLSTKFSLLPTTCQVLI